MAKEEKQTPEEKAKGFPPAEADEKKDAPAAQDSKEKSDGKESAPELAQETPEKATVAEGKETPAEAEKQPETDAEKPAEADSEPPAEKSSDSAESDSAEAETPAAEPVPNTELLEVKAQLAAYKSGVRGDVVEDAVCLAVHDAQKAGELTDKTIAKALEGVLERHPEWKNAAENTAGFRVGADGSQKPPASNDAIAQIFGNK